MTPVEDTTDRHAAAVLAAIRSRHFAPPEGRVFFSFVWLEDQTELLRSEILAALVHLQREDFIETDFEPEIGHPDRLVPHHGHGVHLVFRPCGRKDWPQ